MIKQMRIHGAHIIDIAHMSAVLNALSGDTFSRRAAFLAPHARK